LTVVSLSDPEVDNPVPPDTPAPQPSAKRRGPSRRAIIEWTSILAVAVLAAVILRAFIVQPYFIPSGSMEPTLKVGDKVLVNKLSYDFHGVHRGDIIVFKKPPNDNTPGITDLIKRVIGLPGETIESGPNGEILINGQAINQPWLTPEAKANPGPPVPKMVIPPGTYFVMGDNRGDSSDSREIGPIAKHLIIGRAFLLVWPLSRIGTL
jgi:signal peptidase I